MKQERTRIAVQSQTQAAELDARNAEYQDLPRAPLEFMPVTIEVAVTETESEKKAQLALADIIGKNSDLVGSAVGTPRPGCFPSRWPPSDIKTEPDVPSETILESARAGYYDAKVEVQEQCARRRRGPTRSASSRRPRKSIQRGPALAGTGANQMKLNQHVFWCRMAMALPCRCSRRAADPQPQDESTRACSPVGRSSRPCSPGHDPRLCAARPDPARTAGGAAVRESQYSLRASTPAPCARRPRRNSSSWSSALNSRLLGQGQFVVAGHTDAKGSAQYNKQLSLRRAEAVKRFSLPKGMDPGRLDTVGYGSEHLLVPDRPEDPGNRRVEIRDLGRSSSHGAAMTNARLHVAALLDAASEPYRSAGRFAYYFARGKLRTDPVYRAILELGLLRGRTRVLDLGCGQGLLTAWLRAAEHCYQRGIWPCGLAAGAAPALDTRHRVDGTRCGARARARSGADIRGFAGRHSQRRLRRGRTPSSFWMYCTT